MTTTKTAFALDLAREAATNPISRLRLRHAIDAARDELVDAGAPEAAEKVVGACLRLANIPELSASGCAGIPFAIVTGMTQQEKAQRELETGSWLDYADGRELARLVCLFDGAELLASMAVFVGDELTVDAAKTYLLECEGMTEAEAHWVVLSH